MQIVEPAQGLKSPVADGKGPIEANRDQMSVDESLASNMTPKSPTDTDVNISHQALHPITFETDRLQ